MLERICALPSGDGSVQAVFSFLLDQEPEFPCQGQGLIPVLLNLEREILERISTTTQFSSLYRQSPASPHHSPEAKLRRHGRGVSPMLPSHSAKKAKEFELEVLDGSSDESFALVKITQRVHLFDCFLCKLTRRISVWEYIRLLKEGSQEDWAWDQRRGYSVL